MSLITKALAKDGEIVQDSVLISVPGLKTPREVDILRIIPDEFSSIKIAIEAKDYKRKVTQTTLDELSGKFRGESRVRVDKFYIVSSNGFTKGAIDRAKKDAITLMTLSEAKEFDWSKASHTKHVSRLFEQAKSVTFDLPAHICDIDIVPPLPATSKNEILKDAVLMCPRCRTGKHHGAFRKYMSDAVLRGRDARVHEPLRKLMEFSRANSSDAHLNLRFVSPPDDIWFLGHGDDKYPIREIRVVVHAASIRSQATCKSYELTSNEAEKKIIHQISADLESYEFQMIMPGGKETSRIALTIKQNRKSKRLAQKKSKYSKKSKKADLVHGIDTKSPSEPIQFVIAPDSYPSLTDTITKLTPHPPLTVSSKLT